MDYVVGLLKGIEESQAKLMTALQGGAPATPALAPAAPIAIPAASGPDETVAEQPTEPSSPSSPKSSTLTNRIVLTCVLSKFLCILLKEVESNVRQNLPQADRH